MTKNLTDMYSGVISNDKNRRENDLYETPPLAAYILQKYIDVPEKVVEPCAGRGNIAIELQRNGHDVRCFDAFEYKNSFTTICIGQDVLELEKQKGYDALVTNPPYFKDLPRKIAQKAVTQYDFVAFFIRLTFFEGQKRNKLFTNNPPSDIIFLSDRIKFKPNCAEEPIEKDDQIGGMIAYAWVVWNKKAVHENTKCQWVLLKDEYKHWLKNYEDSIL